MCSAGRSRTSAAARTRFDKVAVLGGSSVSACPEHYPDFDYLHVGELGDATDELFARLADDVTRPQRQVVLTTKVRRELTEFPIPAYELAQIDRYLLGSIQFSSGCPYQCEFCDIPALYGRVARYKTPEQVCAELDKLVACGLSTSVYFVDDNFIANKTRRARDAAASDRVAEAQRLSAAAVLRGDAQHRQAAGNPRADARGGCSPRSSAASRRPIPTR